MHWPNVLSPQATIVASLRRAAECQAPDATSTYTRPAGSAGTFGIVYLAITALLGVPEVAALLRRVMR